MDNSKARRNYKLNHRRQLRVQLPGHRNPVRAQTNECNNAVLWKLGRAQCVWVSCRTDSKAVVVLQTTKNTVTGPTRMRYWKT